MKRRKLQMALRNNQNVVFSNSNFITKLSILKRIRALLKVQSIIMKSPDGMSLKPSLVLIHIIREAQKIAVLNNGLLTQSRDQS